MVKKNNVIFKGSVLLVADVNASKQFYSQLMDQKIEMDFGACVGYLGGFSIWDASYAYQMMELDDSIKKPLGQRNVELYFESDDIDSINDLMKDNHVDFVHHLKEQPWGQRCFRVYDPDRHIIEIAEPMPLVIQRYAQEGLSLEEISKKTMIPLEIVKHVLG
jgi:catechol 2,3-dioxygenase-like lactoylglutathione lyase family enzyme